MRLILHPIRMAQLSLTPTDIANVVREQNRDFPAGTIGREPAPRGTELTIPVITQGRLTDVKDFEEMIVRALPDGSMIRLKDVAKIELGAQSYSLEGRWNGKPNVFLLTFLSPGANALDTVKRVRKEMDAVSKSFPHGVSYDIPYDTTRFIEVSIKEVVKTLAQAMVLVICAVFVPVGFLGGITGELYKQFAITIAISVIISGMVALTLSPALCSLVLKPGHSQRRGFFGVFNRFFGWTQARYTTVVGTILNRSVLSLVLFGIIGLFAVGLFRTIPSSFLPEEDQGYFITIVQLPDGASKQRTDVVLSKI